ncbi:hypothetical protein FRB94_010228 [Tulasnella sp. JGI-2019a]|nr:hypothetical protein FRB94_010228 [Tulasnella sp. JGI-2019a]
MTSFGVGLATSVLVEVANAIIDIVKEIKENKKQCEVLGQRCIWISTAIENVVDSNKANLASHNDTYLAMAIHVQEFDKILRAIQSEMEGWASKRLWTRVFKKATISDTLEELNIKLMDRWQLFQNFLTIQNIGVSAVTAGLMVKSIQDYETARDEDAIANALVLKGIQESVALAQRNKASLDDHTNKLVTILAGVNKLQAPIDKPEDPEAVSARNAIREAIQAYEGQVPAIGIDSSELTLPFEEPYHRGQNADIFKGIRRGKIVAIKKVNVLDAEEIDIVYRRILSESHIWDQLCHPNISQFLGCCRPQNDLAYMISAWAENGDARKYIKQNPNANRLKLVSLEYLHAFVDPRSRKLMPIIHASVKGNHVLVDGDGTAQLSDFGIAFIVDEVYPGSRPPATRWSSPEVLNGETLVSSPIFGPWVWSFWS